MRGKFISFEGPEGAGKSTLIRALSEWISLPNLVTREPGDGPAGAMIRAALLEGGALDAWAETFLFLADRSQHIEKVIEPALVSGQVVLCDRFADSTVVYQGYGRGLPLDKLRELNLLATRGLKPDLTVLLDIEPQIGLNRIENKDRLDSEPIEFHSRIRAGFLAEAELDPTRWLVLDASEPSGHVLQKAKDALICLGVSL